MAVEGVLEFDDIRPDRQEIFRYMGIPERESPEEIKSMVSNLSAAASAICRPRFCCRFLEFGGCLEEFITLSGVTFRTGRIISAYFAEADSCLVYVVSSGREFDDWTKAIASSGDIVSTLVADSIGSEIAEAASRRMLKLAADKLATYGLKTGNSYSPGYCGWDVYEQKKLFSLLPEKPAGVTLNRSSLMSPVKSVSGIVPVGNRVKKRAYGCAICDKQNCYKRVSDENKRMDRINNTQSASTCSTDNDTSRDRTYGQESQGSGD